MERGDVWLANLCLAGVMAVFVLLTLIAFLLTDGRSYCVVPLLRKYFPRCSWVVDHDTRNTVYEELLVIVGLDHHAMGSRRPTNNSLVWPTLELNPAIDKSLIHLLDQLVKVAWNSAIDKNLIDLFDQLLNVEWNPAIDKDLIDLFVQLLNVEWILLSIQT